MTEGGVRGPRAVMVVAFTVAMAAVSGNACALRGQEAIEIAAAAFARQWGAGDLDQIRDVLYPAGVRVGLPGERANLVSVRQAVAGLRDFQAGHEAGEARVTRVAEVGGVPLRAFAEISWAASPTGTSERRDYLVFVSFVREDEAWRVTEVRVLH